MEQQVAPVAQTFAAACVQILEVQYSEMSANLVPGIIVRVAVAIHQHHHQPFLQLLHLEPHLPMELIILIIYVRLNKNT